MVTLPYHEDRMHDGSAPAWRQTIDRLHAALVDDLAAQVSAEADSRAAAAVAAERARAAAETTAVLDQANRLRADAESILDEAGRLRAEAEAARAEALKALADERVDAAAAAAAAADEARRRLSESLNQTLRRLRRTSAEHETLQLLLEDSAPFAERAVVLLIENNHARIADWRGVPRLREEEAESAPIELREAAALASCVATGDPLVALAAPAELSPLLAAALGDAPSAKVCLFPVTSRQTTGALLLAAGAVSPAPLELMCEAAGMKLESLEPPPPAPDRPAPAPLVRIAGAPEPGPASRPEPDAWSDLAPEDQALHLRAQRTARVRVAQMRISESEALRQGVRSAAIYDALRSSIDAARDEFRRSCMTLSPTMVDYLHLELVRSLARDDSALLGPNYPGPLA